MNYRHAYHAGNFADVVKHAVLALVIEHLKRKEAPFRVIDTHAGRGRYELVSGPARRTGEWQGGIGRLLGPEAACAPEPAARLLAPYLEVVRRENPGGGLRAYPGGPRVARALLRRDDTLVVNELHRDDARALGQLFTRDRQTKVLALDGWIALKSLLPPKERRGVVLIDPPFEEPGEFVRMTFGLAEAIRRFATGVYLLWYPIKDERLVARFHNALAGLGLARLLIAEVSIRPARNPNVLSGCGLAIVNPPYRLGGHVDVLLQFLAHALAVAPGGGHRLLWISGEDHAKA
jgi:23S rRNA (adenine2030-N6)-methyltransferase